jgi:hypothetical protein
MIFRNEDGLLASIVNWLAFATRKAIWSRWYALQTSRKNRMSSGLGPIFFLTCEDCGVETDTICRFAEWSSLSKIWCPSCRLPKLRKDGEDMNRRTGYVGQSYLDKADAIVKGVPDKIAADDYCSFCPQYVKCMTLGV